MAPCPPIAQASRVDTGPVVAWAREPFATSMQLSLPEARSACALVPSSASLTRRPRQRRLRRRHVLRSSASPPRQLAPELLSSIHERCARKACDARLACVVHSLPEQNSTPALLCPSSQSPASRHCRGRASPSRRGAPDVRPQDGFETRRSFRRRRCGRHHPCRMERVRDCPAPPLAARASPVGARPRSYSDLLPCVRPLNHPADRRGTEEPPSAAAAAPRLVLLVAPSVTSLGARGPRSSRPTCALPGRRSFPARHCLTRAISRGRSEKLPGTLERDPSRGLAPSPKALTGKPLRAFHG